MRNPILVTTSHTEPMFTPADFPHALERVTTALDLALASQGLVREGRARVRVLKGDRPAGVLPLLSGCVVARPPDLPDDPDPSVADWQELVAVSEPTA